MFPVIGERECACASWQLCRGSFEQDRRFWSVFSLNFQLFTGTDKVLGGLVFEASVVSRFGVYQNLTTLLFSR